ncbi:endonuclease/exonuclease/phosphatase family protein [Parabacteroides sp.]
MNEAAAYIKQLQPDIICFQEAPGDGYYHWDSIWQAFDYVLYKYISRRTDHLPTTIYSRYPIHSVKALYYKNSSHRLRKGLTDGFRDCGSGYQYTFRQLYKLWRIDYVFYSESLKGRACYSPETSYSDHNMVVWKGIIN